MTIQQSLINIAYQKYYNTSYHIFPKQDRTFSYITDQDAAQLYKQK